MRDFFIRSTLSKGLRLLNVWISLFCFIFLYSTIYIIVDWQTVQNERLHKGKNNVVHRVSAWYPGDLTRLTRGQEQIVGARISQNRKI